MREMKRHVGVLGLKETGYLSSLYLAEKGYKVFATDLSSNDAVKKNAENLRLKGIEAECGGHSMERIISQDWFLISPGIPPASELYQKITTTGKPVHSEIEVAHWFSQAKSVIAVTGSCGKTTLATLIATLIEAVGGKAVLCGNIGNPWIGELARIDRDTTVVLEVSSFQLMHCSKFSPEVGILLNVYPNHMDWHHDMAEYANAKLMLFKNMRNSGTMICRKKDERTFFPDFKTAAKRVYFDEGRDENPNCAALLCVADVLGISEQKTRSVFAGFPGIEHRLEKFSTHKGTVFINDSKCTTPASLAWALEKFSDGTVVLVCGGKAKSSDFGTLKDLVAKKVKCAILIGTSRHMIRDSWRGATEILETADFDEACDWVVKKSAPGDVALLSPACASFDMFKNYQDRGRIFKEKIHQRMKINGAGICLKCEK